LQYYLDLGDEFECEGATGGVEPGYLSMNSMALEEPTDYTKMSPAPPPPGGPEDEKLCVDLSGKKKSDMDAEERYVNFDLTKKNAAKDRNKSKQNEIEVQPLLHNVDERMIRDSPGRRRHRHGSPTRLSGGITLDSPANEDSDSGHESFAPGSSPDKCDENDGYLSPRSMQDVPLLPLNGVGPKSGSQKSASNGQVRGGSNNKYRYSDLPPPDYRAVMEANETNV